MSSTEPTSIGVDASPSGKAAAAAGPESQAQAEAEAQLRSLLGTPLRVLLEDRRTIHGELESVDCNSLLLSSVLETRAPPTTYEEAMVHENEDRYYPRSDPHLALEIPGLGIARDIGMVVVNLTDIVKIEVEHDDWKAVQARIEEKAASII